MLLIRLPLLLLKAEFLVFTQSQGTQKTIDIEAMLVSQTKEITQIVLLRVHQHGHHEVIWKLAMFPWRGLKPRISLLVLMLNACFISFYSSGGTSEILIICRHNKKENFLLHALVLISCIFYAVCPKYVHLNFKNILACQFLIFYWPFFKGKHTQNNYKTKRNHRLKKCVWSKYIDHKC